MKRLPIRLLRPSAVVPTRATEGSVGYDIYACLSEPLTILPGETCMVGTGFALALEPGYGAFLYARSGLGIKRGIVPANCVGVVDADYRGEVIVGLRNSSHVPYQINPRDRIAQMVICRCELPELVVSQELEETARGSGGFGSTG